MTRRPLALLTAVTLAAGLLVLSPPARAQFTETLPKHTWMLEIYIEVSTRTRLR